MQQPTKEQFLEGVKNHKIEVVRDDGIHRHLVMTKGGSAMRYEIITCPWFLFYCGDMGSFTFRRLEDNFEFFRPRNGELAINPGYWHEKLEAVDRCSGSREFSRDVFESNIKDYEGQLADERAEVWKEIEDEVLNCDSNEVRAFDAANDFRFKGFSFSDYWETDNTDFTYRYIWCLYAIVHGIMEYDKLKQRGVLAAEKE